MKRKERPRYFTSMLAQPRSNDSVPAPGTVTVACAVYWSLSGSLQCSAGVWRLTRMTSRSDSVAPPPGAVVNGLHPNAGPPGGAGPLVALCETSATSYDEPRAASWACSTARKSTLGGVGPGWV